VSITGLLGTAAGYRSLCLAAAVRCLHSFPACVRITRSGISGISGLPVACAAWALCIIPAGQWVNRITIITGHSDNRHIQICPFDPAMPSETYRSADLDSGILAGPGAFQ
jgi:hypothetical protein